MSRQSKNAKRMGLARAASLIRVAGGHGPAKTTPVHGKDPSRRHYSADSREAPKRQGAPR